MRLKEMTEYCKDYTNLLSLWFSLYNTPLTMSCYGENIPLQTGGLLVEIRLSLKEWLSPNAAAIERRSRESRWKVTNPNLDPPVLWWRVQYCAYLLPAFLPAVLLNRTLDSPSSRRTPLLSVLDSHKIGRWCANLHSSFQISKVCSSIDKVKNLDQSCIHYT